MYSGKWAIVKVKGTGAGTAVVMLCGTPASHMGALGFSPSPAPDAGFLLRYTVGGSR